MRSDTFEVGDFIGVITQEGLGSVVRGAALDKGGNTGYAFFRLQLPRRQNGEEGQIIDFNLNQVEVKNLFRAEVARRFPGA